MIARKQSTTTYPVQFLMVDSTDHVTAETGLSPTVTISKNGGAYGAASGAVTEVGNGVYSYAGNATDRDTLGELMIHAEATGADKVDMKVLITSYDPFVDIAAILADTGTDGVALKAAGLAADAVTEIQNGLATATALSTVSGLVDDLESRLTAARAGYLDNLNTGVALTAAGVDAILDEAVVGSYTMRQLLKVFASALAGKLSGGGTTTLTFRGIDDASNVIVATVDASGNRSAVTINV